MKERTQTLAGLSVLVAEDEYLVVREVRRLLTRAGCADVQIAGNLADAERLARDGQFDAALLDIKLGEHDVFALAETLDRAGVPVIFVTGYATEMVPDHLARLPMIQKPFPRKRLLETLEQVALGSPGHGKR